MTLPLIKNCVGFVTSLPTRPTRPIPEERVIGKNKINRSFDVENTTREKSGILS